MSSALEAYIENITIVRGLSRKTIEAYLSDLSDFERFLQKDATPYYSYIFYICF